MMQELSGFADRAIPQDTLEKLKIMFNPYLDARLVPPSWRAPQSANATKNGRLRFTPAEDGLLVLGMERYGRNWSKIQEHVLPSKTVSEIMHRWKNQSCFRRRSYANPIFGQFKAKVDDRKRWSAENIAKLCAGVEKHGFGQWKLIASSVFNGEFDRSECRRKYNKVVAKKAQDEKRLAQTSGLLTKIREHRIEHRGAPSARRKPQAAQEAPIPLRHQLDFEKEELSDSTPDENNEDAQWSHNDQSMQQDDVSERSVDRAANVLSNVAANVLSNVNGREADRERRWLREQDKAILITAQRDGTSTRTWHQMLSAQGELFGDHTAAEIASRYRYLLEATKDRFNGRTTSAPLDAETLD